MQGSKSCKRDKDVKNRLLDSVGEGKGGMIWENSIETGILPYVKLIKSAGSVHESKALKAGALGQPRGMRWGGRWEGHSRWGHMSTCDWFISMCGKNHHNFVKYPLILYPRIKIILKKKQKNIYLKLIWDSYFYLLKNYTLTEKLTMYVGNYFSRILLISKIAYNSNGVTYSKR